jgi:hypothetical protein
MNNNDALIKTAESIVNPALSGDYGKVAEEFNRHVGGMIRTIVREASLAEAILPVKTVTPNTPGMQLYMAEDRFRYVEEIEQDALAFETSFRAGTTGTFRSTKRYAIDIGMIKTEKYRKPEQELWAAPKLVDMLRKNGANYIIRRQDALFMDALLRATKASIWSYPHNMVTDWTSGIVGADLVDLKTLITDQELVPSKWIASVTGWNELSKVDNSDVGDMAGKVMIEGFPGKQIYNLPCETTIKGKLARDDKALIYDSTGSGNELTDDSVVESGDMIGSYKVEDETGTKLASMIQNGEITIGDLIYSVDATPKVGQVIGFSGSTGVFVYPVPVTSGAPAPWDGSTTLTAGWKVYDSGKFFDHVLENGHVYTKFYLAVAPDYLGKILRMGEDRSHSKWEENIFEWTAWRNIGMGFGDIRGLAMINIRIR